MRRPSQPVWYSLAAILVSMALMFVFTAVSLDRSAREAERAARAAAAESERKWCALINTLDEAYRSNPPTSPIGRQLAGDISRLRAQFEC